MVHSSHTIRRPVVAGQFYTGDPVVLRQQIEAFLATGACPEKSADKGRESIAPCGDPPTMLAMVPHAGYVYSGAVAGQTLGAARLAETVILLGPNHTGRGEPVAVWPGGEWLSPLGSVPVDGDFTACLVKSDPVFSLDTAAHLYEHSLEVLLPFLQVARPGVKIVPIAIASPSPEVLARCGAALARCIQAYGAPVTMIVSTDMSHYVSHQEARRNDLLALAMVESLDPEGLYNTVREHGITMCGVLPMTTGLVACRLLGAERASLICYATSGEVSGDMDKVVGYAGALVHAPRAACSAEG
ncbi:MAG: AmmeMemoRadiSam system protein B [Halodesulfovibrio sp.]